MHGCGSPARFSVLLSSLFSFSSSVSFSFLCFASLTPLSFSLAERSLRQQSDTALLTQNLLPHAPRLLSLPSDSGASSVLAHSLLEGSYPDLLIVVTSRVHSFSRLLSVRSEIGATSLLTQSSLPHTPWLLSARPHNGATSLLTRKPSSRHASVAQRSLPQRSDLSAETKPSSKQA